MEKQMSSLKLQADETTKQKEVRVQSSVRNIRLVGDRRSILNAFHLL